MYRPFLQNGCVTAIDLVQPSLRKTPTTALLIDAYKHRFYSINFDYRSIKSSIVQPKALARLYIESALALLIILLS